jgi:hypothetical protein
VKKYRNHLSDRAPHGRQRVNPPVIGRQPNRHPQAERLLQRAHHVQHARGEVSVEENPAQSKGRFLRPSLLLSFRSRRRRAGRLRCRLRSSTRFAPRGFALCGRIRGVLGRSPFAGIIRYIPTGSLELKSRGRKGAFKLPLANGTLAQFWRGKALNFFKTVAACSAAVFI